MVENVQQLMIETDVVWQLIRKSSRMDFYSLLLGEGGNMSPKTTSK